MVWILSLHAKRRFYTLIQQFRASADARYTSLPAILLFSFNASSELQCSGTIRTKCNVIEVAVLQDCSGFIYSMDIFNDAGTTNSPPKTESLASQRSVGFHCLIQDPGFAAHLSPLSILATAMDRTAKTLISHGESKDSVSLYNLETLRKKEQEDPSRE